MAMRMVATAMVKLAVTVKDAAGAAAWYGALLGVEPEGRDDGSWEIEVPGLHLVLTVSAGTPGLRYVGVRLLDEQDVDAVSRRLQAIGAPAATADGPATVCCADPAGLRWVVSVDPTGCEETS